MTIVKCDKCEMELSGGENGKAVIPATADLGQQSFDLCSGCRSSLIVYLETKVTMP
jgi:hypothetical protein